MDLLLVFNETLEMLNDRKYILPKFLRETKLTNDHMRKIFLKGHATMYAKKKVKKNNKIVTKKVMIFFTTEKFGKKEVREKIDELAEKKINHIILIIAEKFTQHGQKLLSSIKKLEREIFYFKELSINPVKHSLSPKHELLSEEETKKFNKNVASKMPLIKKNADRINRHYNGKVGQIYRIFRADGTITYRRIVKDD